MERLASVVTTDLANTFGNLLLRILSKKLHSAGTELKYYENLFPFHGDSVTAAAVISEEDRAFIETLHKLPGDTRQQSELLIGIYHEHVATILGSEPHW